MDVLIRRSARAGFGQMAVIKTEQIQHPSKNPFFNPCFVISTVIAPTGRAIDNPTTINARNICNRLELPLEKFV